MSTNQSGLPPIPPEQSQEALGQTRPRPSVVPTSAPAGAAAGSAASEDPGKTVVTPIAPVPAADPLPTAASPAHKKGGARNGRAVLAGAVGGACASAALVAALWGMGFIGRGASVAITSSPAAQTVNITAASDDASISQAVAAKTLPSVVSVIVETAEGEGSGSGVVLDKDGNIITNYHVIEDAESISVTIDGKSLDATLVGSDASSDLAVIHVDLKDVSVTPIEVGNSDDLVVGDWVMTVGSPFGLDQSVSAGIVSALTRNSMLTSSSGNTLYTNLIQVDAAINPGNSGGALVDSEGRLVGICTLYTSSTESFAGIGFAIPGNYAVDVANKIVAGETVTHAYIGLSMQTVNSQNALRNKLSVSQGAYVSAVTEGSPADQAGIQRGDIITAVNGEEITSADGMILSVRSHNIGETVSVTLMRGTEERTVSVTLGSDEQLQKELEEERSRQNTISDNGLRGDVPERNNGGTTDGLTRDDVLEYLERLYNERVNGGGSTGLFD